MTSYRFIIVGAGSAGCVLADRLSEDPANEVLLLEAGGRDLNPFIHIPAGIAKLVRNPRINWHYQTEPEAELQGRRLYWPRGKVLGGSSSINAMCYVRGQPEDYDGWARAGNEGWDFSDVLPYFIRSERQALSSPLRHSPYHGHEGRLHVESLRDSNPLSHVFIDAAEALGEPRNDDFNGPVQRGFGLYQVTQRDGRRCSTAAAYLRAAARRPNLTIATHSVAVRIGFEHSRAREVEFLRRGRIERARCEGEVLICAGAVNSPQLLMLSGIGRPEHLSQFDITVQCASPGVGLNLQDHLDICVLQKATQSVTYDLSASGEVLAALRYALDRRGPLVSNIAEAGGFTCSSQASGNRPDIQFHFVPAQLDDHGRNRLPGHGFTVHACFLQPFSRGHIELRSARASDPPAIFANYLHDGRDLIAMVEAVELSRALFASAPFAPYRGPELFPGPAVRSRDGIVNFIRARAETIYHPTGTCRMGIDDAAVVDPQLRVHGVEGLRVVDASVMPTLVSGNTNAPTIMIAEKAADMILGRPALPRFERPVAHRRDPVLSEARRRAQLVQPVAPS